MPLILFGLAVMLAAVALLGSRKSGVQAKIAAALSGKSRKPKTSHYAENLKVNKARAPGQWLPVDFKPPTPPPFPDWSIKETLPVPYRPYRRGVYHVTMGIRSMDFDEWIELDNQWPEYHRLKCERIAARADKCVKTDPRAFDAAVELLECFREYLPARYPSLFNKTDSGIENLHTGEKFDIFERPLKEDPMAIAAKLTQDDLAIMIEGEDGQYYLLAGAILLAGFWRLCDKFGMPLAEIHTSGDVPKFREKLQGSMERFFVKLQPEKPVLRNNVAREPFAPGKLAEAIRSWQDDVARYKGRRKYRDVILKYLDEQNQLQLDGGLCNEHEIARYPF